ncbi:MAG: metal ABC transporter permease [Planctomycetaceae bacterium]|nr:metal ABC transporter permease [Planctomycetaceae bacterium]
MSRDRISSAGRLAALLVWTTLSLAAAGDESPAIETQSASSWWRLVTFQDYNTWVPLVATALIGLSAGVVGTFLVLRGRALVGDVVGHAALPGIVLGFLAADLFGGSGGRSIPLLLGGALLTGLLGAGCVLLIDRYSKIKSDAALAIVLSLFYGGGTVLLSVAQRLDSGSQAGLKNYLSGKTASLVAGDVWLSGVLAVVLLGVTLLLFKEWTLLCFDDGFGATQGYPSGWLDTLLIGLAAVISVLGMQSVGLVLVVGLLIIPPAAARFWTDDIRWMTLGSGLIGAASGGLGVAASSLAPRIATGPTVVLTGSLVFIVSLCCGRRRGLVWRALEQRRFRRQILRQDLLRAGFESVEEQLGKTPSAAELSKVNLCLDGLRAEMGCEPAVARSVAEAAAREGLLREVGDDCWRLTPSGAEAAAAITRNHRLWELYLMEYADVAPALVHRHADAIEHVLEPRMVAELEQLLDQRGIAAPSSGEATQH